ncbi:MAG: hypothetical protein ABIJ97_15780 [Bacteroidota bacterium]
MKKIILIFCLLLSVLYGFSQYTVVTDDSTYTPLSTNALFEVYSQNMNKGVLIPRMRTVERTAIITSGITDQSLLVYDTDTKTFWYFDGIAWVEIATGGTVSDDQLITFSNDTLYIEDGNSVYLGNYLDNTDTQTLTINGNDISISNGNTVTLPISAAGWQLTGNAGTDISTNFLGTTDNMSLALKTNNTERMRLLNSGNIGIGTTAPTAGLHISLSSSAQPTLTVEHNSNNGTDAAFQLLSQGTARALLHSNGSGYFMNNIGIGLTSPTEMLDVTGNIKASGVAYWGNSGTRTETRDDAGISGVNIRSGFYETSSPTPAGSWPTGATNWWHLLDIRHSSSSNNYALQFAGSFFDQKLFFRKTNNNASQTWTEVVTTSNYTGGITYDYSNASMTAPNGSMSVIPGMTRTMTLNAGDVVYLHAHGGVMASGINYANVECAIRVNGADLPNGGYTKVSVDYDVAWQPFANWAVSGHYVVPSAGSYTFAAYAGRFGGNGDASVGGNNTTVTQGSLRIEVRPGN